MPLLAGSASSQAGAGVNAHWRDWPGPELPAGSWAGRRDPGIRGEDGAPAISCAMPTNKGVIMPSFGSAFCPGPANNRTIISQEIIWPWCRGLTRG